MRTNRNKAISHYQKEANLLRNDYDEYEDEEQDENEIPHNDDAAQIATEPVESPDSSRAAGVAGTAGAANTEAAQGAGDGAESASIEGASEATGEVAKASETEDGAESGAPAICPHVLSVYETVMLIQLKRMIKRNTKAFAVMLKILIQGDPKRKS